MGGKGENGVSSENSVHKLAFSPRPQQPGKTGLEPTGSRSLLRHGELDHGLLVLFDDHHRALAAGFLRCDHAPLAHVHGGLNLPPLVLQLVLVIFQGVGLGCRNRHVRQHGFVLRRGDFHDGSLVDRHILREIIRQCHAALIGRNFDGSVLGLPLLTKEGTKGRSKQNGETKC